MRAKLHPLISMIGIGVIVFLYVPLFAVMLYSFNVAKKGYVWKGFTFDWYIKLFQNEEVFGYARNTLVLAVVSTAISTVLGTLLALGMNRFPWPRRLKSAFDLLVYLPVVTPDIVFAAAMVVAFTFLRYLSGVFEFGMATMIIAHVTFQVAFVAMVVQSRLATFGRTYEEAARDLYASTRYLMWRIVLPMLAPGIFAGAMLAFTLSLDDFVISFFTKGTDSTTLPIWIQSEFRRGLTPLHHALSTVIFLTTVLLVLGLERLTRKER
jgi:spermidine/putrescine transport system permease protein